VWLGTARADKGIAFMIFQRTLAGIPASGKMASLPAPPRRHALNSPSWQNVPVFTVIVCWLEQPAVSPRNPVEF
jgi:hypothetical protein